MIPVYLLTGFLGSGKTTLLRALLARRAERAATGKLGVVINELGAVGIDAALVGGEGPRQVELAGGCVCCALGPELGATLRELAAAEPDLGAIVLETSGAAEPLPIAWALEAPALAAGFRLAAIVTVIDAAEFARSRAVSPSTDAQARAADVVVLSKLDVASAAEVAAARAGLGELAPAAPRLEGGHAAAAAWLDDVLDDGGAGVAQVGARLAAASAGGHGLVSVAVDVDAVVDLEELEDALAALPGEVVRIKGVLRAVDGRRGAAAAAPGWVEVHRVGLRTSSAPLAQPPGLARGRLVAIGARVDEETLREAVLASTPTS